VMGRAACKKYHINNPKVHLWKPMENPA